jgi:hypothetical protein
MQGFNAHYIKNYDTEKLWNKLETYLRRYDNEYLEKIISYPREFNIKVLTELQTRLKKL